jgi:hypothetical protein
MRLSSYSNDENATKSCFAPMVEDRINPKVQEDPASVVKCAVLPKAYRVIFSIRSLKCCQKRSLIFGRSFSDCKSVAALATKIAASAAADFASFYILANSVFSGRCALCHAVAFPRTADWISHIADCPPETMSLPDLINP